VIRLFVLFVLVMAARPASAQYVPTTEDDPVAKAPFRFGALALDPNFTLQNIGVDTNVFNASEDPQSDFTMTTRGGTDMWLRTGRGLLSASGWLEYAYYQDFPSERSFNSYGKGQYEWRFNRLRPYASGSYLDTRERPGYEIDERVRRYEADFHAGTDFKVAPKTTLRLDFRRLDYEFADDEIVDGRPIDQRLNRTLEAADFSWRQRLTALTTWVVRAAREQERFHTETFRNSETFRFNTGFELAQFALIRGSAIVGYRHLYPADGGLFPEFSGFTSNINVSYTAPTNTRLTAVFNRDVQYSYDIRTPYYLQTTWTGTLTHRVVGRWDIQVTGGRDRLAYQALSERDARTDYVGRVGGGVGYTVGNDMRVSFDVQSFYRSSLIEAREYGNLRAGLSVTYGY
jgi:hypothetical protein